MDFAILALATWRITSLLYTEDGPYMMLVRLRAKLGVYYDDHSQRQGRNEVAKAFICPACLSVWVGGAVALSCVVLPAWFYLPLALSAVTTIVEGVMPNGKS